MSLLPASAMPPLCRENTCSAKSPGSDLVGLVTGFMKLSQRKVRELAASTVPSGSIAYNVMPASRSVLERPTIALKKLRCCCGLMITLGLSKIGQPGPIHTTSFLPDAWPR